MISDIVSDEPVPEHLPKIPISGAAAFPALSMKKIFFKPSKRRNFTAFSIEEFRSEAYQTVEGIEFRAITITAYKGKEGACIERNQAVIYRGPWKQVVDDDGHTLPRGVRVAVCEKTYQLYSKPPYQDQFIFVPPREEVAAGKSRCLRLLARS